MEPDRYYAELCEPEMELHSRRGHPAITIVRPTLAPLQVIYPKGLSPAQVKQQLSHSLVYQEVLALQRAPIANPILPGYATTYCTFQFVTTTESRLAANIADRCVELQVPEGYPLDCYRVQRFAFKVLTEVLRGEAKYHIPQLVATEANRLCLAYNSVTIRKVHSRWGSCSSRAGLNFSLFAMLLPTHLLRYVVLHEMAHLTYMNHGPHFWALLDIYLEADARALQAQLDLFKPNTPRLF